MGPTMAMTSSPRSQRRSHLVLFFTSLVVTFMLNDPGAIWSSETDTTKKEAESIEHDTPIITSTTTSLLIPEHPDSYCRDRVLSAIEGVVLYNQSRFIRCPVTSQVRIFLDTWILESLDSNGDSKTVGGDEYYITYADDSYQEHVTAVARALDREDGTYKLQWTASPMLSRDKLAGTGTLHIHFEYTCGIGRMGQPTKNEWHFGGSTHTDYVVENVTSPDFRSFRPPKTDINLADFDKVFVLGDSVMGNFIGRDDGNFDKTNIVSGTSPASALNSKTVDAWLQQLKSNHSDEILKTSNAAVLTGSSTWDILRNDVDQGMTWKDHETAARKLITSIRNEFPSVTVLWKSATAIHICNPNIEEMAEKSKYWGIERVRYMSESRSRDIDQVQRNLMQELDVPVLDVYEATYLSADWARQPHDARHYDAQLNRVMLNWFYRD